MSAVSAKLEPLTFLFEDDGLVPNNPMPFLVYKGVVALDHGHPEATIERLGDAYLVTYKKGPLTAYIAVGIRHGDTFCLAWANQGQVGVTLYKIEPGPRLVGQYTHLGGAGILNQETLTRARKTIDARLR